MGPEEKLMLINSLINSLEEVKKDEKLLNEFQMYSEVHGVHLRDKYDDIIATRKIYRNVEIVLPLDNPETFQGYPEGITLEPF